MKLKLNIFLLLLCSCFSLTVEATNQTPGCMNPGACNFDSNATEDDGSCIFPYPNCECGDIVGCTDPNSANYDPNATCDNGSCLVIGVPGCPDPNACNYNPNTYIDNGSCVYPFLGCTCADITGCTNPDGLNYNPTATCDDGSCVLPDEIGCTDPVACNYNPNAIIDNGACQYPTIDCDCDDILGWGSDCEDYPPYPTILGCTDPNACNYNPEADIENGTCTYPETGCECDDIWGCVDPLALNYNPEATCGYVCFYDESGCTDPIACNYNPSAITDNGTCTYPLSPDCSCDDIPGCYNPCAPNFNPDVTCDDGSCFTVVPIPVCADPDACNYDPLILECIAIPDNDLCIYTNCTIDLELSQTIDPGTNMLVDPSTFTITVTNDGPAFATEIMVASLLPSGLNYVSHSTTKGDYNAALGIWNVGTLGLYNSNKFATLQITVLANEPGTYTNTAQVIGATQTDIDSTPNNGDSTEDDFADATLTYSGVNSGCTDPAACNYDPMAIVDDGSCDYGVTGCSDPCNAVIGCIGSMDPDCPSYDPLVTCIDPSCDPVGCTDPLACNYNPCPLFADDGSCYYAIPGCECSDLTGCTDPLAENYTPEATCDDGSCAYNNVHFTLSADENGLITAALIPNITWSGADAITSTAQLTFVVPTGGFEPSNLTNVNGEWALNSTVIAPTENPDFDYFTFGLTSLGTADIEYIKGIETPLFTFENVGTCVSSVALIEQNDPFTPPNSENANIGNQITTLGGGNANVWVGNVETAEFDCGCNSIDLELQAFILTGSTSFYEEEPMSYTISLCNVGDCTAYGVSFGETSMSNFTVDSTNMNISNNGTIWSLDSLESFSCINLKVYGSFGLAGNYNPTFEVVEAQPNDVDSTPNNGAMEDDIDNLSIEVLAASNADVWPGDANNDGIANNFDVLDIGLVYGNTGPARIDASTDWEAQVAENWSNYFDNGVNYKHTDCDGNGTIETEDVDVVGLNYGLTHGKKTSTADEGFPIWIEVPETEIESGMLVSFPIHLGNNDFPLDDLYGLAFNLEYDEGLFELGTVEIDFANSWFGPENVEMIGLGYAISPTSVDIGVSRINQINVNGTGAVAAVKGIIDDIAGKGDAIDFNFTISNLKAITAQANEVPFTYEPSSVTVVSDATETSINTLSYRPDLNIYPNPTDGSLNLDFGQETPQSIQFFDLDGKLVYENLNNQRDVLQLEVTDWNKGIYMISIQYEDKLVWEKVVVN